MAYEKLNDQQRLFVDFYVGVSNCSKSDAARRAGYQHPGQYGYQLYRDPDIQAAIKERLQAVAMDADEVLMRISTVARGELGMLLRPVKDPAQDTLTPEEAERLQDAREIRRAVARENDDPEDEEEERFGGFLPGEYGVDLQAAAEKGLLWMVEEFSYDRYGRPKVRFASPLRANELLLQRHGLLKNHVDLTSNGQTVGVINYVITPPGELQDDGDADRARPGAAPER